MDCGLEKGGKVMTDLIERLLHPAYAIPSQGMVLDHDATRRDMAEAAAEIKRLRAEREWRPIETAPKGEIVIGGDWMPEQGGPSWHFFESWWAGDHWVGHPSYWVSASLLPQAPTASN
jgi:hypothetical protein